jgi:hypothetical protein
MRMVGAALLLLVAALLALGEVYAILDPVGAKMSDDADPFGDPHQPWYVHASNFAVSLACAGGAWLLLRPRKKE